MNFYEILINKDNKIDENFYKNFDLIEVLNVEGELIKIEEKTYENYSKLKECLKVNENIQLGILNSFRSFEEQKKICEEFVKIYGAELAYKLAATPGTSEHHSGLAIDITVKKDDNNFAVKNSELYNEEAKFSKVHKYLADYGFILRYPKDKTEITGFNYEPWHIRYIGSTIAKECYEKNIVIEEYFSKKYLSK